VIIAHASLINRIECLSETGLEYYNTGSHARYRCLTARTDDTGHVVVPSQAALTPASAWHGLGSKCDPQVKGEWPGWYSLLSRFAALPASYQLLVHQGWAQFDLQ
jgi:hypothetical protein